MNAIKFFLVLVLLASGGTVWAQTNAPAPAAGDQHVEIDSDHGYFDGITNQVVWLGHVFVTDFVKAKLYCDRLTVDLPKDGGHPTNIVADSNVIADVLIDGQTNHITSAKAVYTYSVINAVTNEIITFSGGDPEVISPQYTIWGDPLRLNVVTKHFDGMQKMIMNRHSNGGTNGSPFDILGNTHP